MSKTLESNEVSREIVDLLRDYYPSVLEEIIEMLWGEEE